MSEIYSILRRVADNFKSLVLDVGNNYCEHYNSIINKHIAGKIINFTKKSHIILGYKQQLYHLIQMVILYVRSIRKLPIKVGVII